MTSRTLILTACLSMLVASCAADVSGWRGDGTGKYPDATPPLHWGRVEKSMLPLRSAGAEPKDGSHAKSPSASQGFFAEWLVLGPVACEDPAKSVKDANSPAEIPPPAKAGDKFVGATWKTVEVNDSYVDLWKSVGPFAEKQIAYAQAYLWSDKPMKLAVHVRHVYGLAFWFNGARVYGSDQHASFFHLAWGPIVPLELKPGWNRFLFRLAPGLKPQDNSFGAECYVRARFWPAEGPHEYVEKNVAWVSPMPGLAMAMPVLAGDRIFVTAQPYNLVCVDKKTGKILWIGQNSPYDAATAAERKANPGLFDKMDGLAKRRADYYRAYVAGGRPNEKEVKEEQALEDELDKLMLDVDKPKYSKPHQQDQDLWCIPTPVTDGQGVYVWLNRGVTAAWSLDGKRRWIRFDPPLEQHHGWYASPTIVDGKLIVLDGTLAAYNPADGSEVWRTKLDKIKSWLLWYGSPVRVRVGNEDYICLEGLDLVRAKDGVFVTQAGPGSFTATPVVDGDKVLFVLNDAPGILTFSPEKLGAAPQPSWFPAPPKETSPNPPGYWYGAKGLNTSPLLHDGLAYFLTSSGVLKVFDALTKRAVYQKELGLDIGSAALLWGNYIGGGIELAGGYIYVTGPMGTMVVIKPGREYVEVARNQVQHVVRSGRALGSYSINPNNYQFPFCPEYTESTVNSVPVFEGRRMYYRAQENLYCIELQ